MHLHACHHLTLPFQTADIIESDSQVTGGTSGTGNNDITLDPRGIPS